MYELAQSEHVCPRCGVEREHTVLRSDDAIVRSLCNACGHQGGGASGMFKPGAGDGRVVYPFGAIYLGGGAVRAEGRLVPTSGRLGAEGRAIVDEARHLAHIGVDFFRLVVTKRAHLALIRRVKEATGRPVVADLGHRVSLSTEALGAGANGLGVVTADAADAHRLARVLRGAPKVPLFVTVSPLPLPSCRAEEAGAELARSALDVLEPLRGGSGRDSVGGVIVLTLDCDFAPVADAAYRQLKQDGRQLLRLYYRAEDGATSPSYLARHGVAVTRRVQTKDVDVLAVDFGPSSLSAEVSVAVLEATRQADGLGKKIGPQFQRDKIVDYVLRKALYRVTTKPFRIMHQWESDPRFVVWSLPGRVITKPMRMWRELRSTARRLSDAAPVETAAPQ